MANPAIPLYNFYFRYKWTDVDFTNWQGGMVDTVHGAMEGGFGAGVVNGMAVTPGSGMHVTVSAGIAVGPTGYMHILGSPATVTINTADATNPRRDLIVARPLSVGASSFTRPTLPFDTVFLQQLQETQILAIAGTPAATPIYPSKGSDDVILAALRVAPGVSSFVQTDINLHIRDIPGKYSNFQQQQARFDDRCRPYVVDNQNLGIKPSQLFEANGFSRVFTYVSQSVASRFPQNGSGGISTTDANYNFQTGAVSGGDHISSSFTPHIPTAGNCIVAAVAIKSDDTINIQFGVIGTRAQCFAAIYNQTQDGSAGSIIAPATAMPICYVILSSKDGVNITELEVLDARTPFSFIGAPTIRRYPNLILAGDGTGDYSTLAAAVAALPSGGVIVLGSDTTVPSNVSIPDKTKIIGRNNTKLILSNGVTVTVGNNCVFEDFIIDHTASSSGNGLNVTGKYFEAINVTFKENAAGTGVGANVSGNSATFSECTFYGVITPSTATGISFTSTAFNGYVDAGCTFLP